ncbi:MAG: carboxylating nicotinate-nucleotide diphosphorylase [Syntrophomonadaceae bacterium]|jgi:nicotinate-nucleotide pyrophosphorylase (carboxylating)
MYCLGIDDLIKRALEEDIGHGDITTINLVNQDLNATGAFIAKSPGVIAGIDICEKVFTFLEPNVVFKRYKQDGDGVVTGDIVASVSGKATTLLTGERVALNFLQRLSGIATKTRSLVELIKYQKAELVDTRKTTPGMRWLEKYAVSVGGARNHRFGLYDGVLIKDNHIAAVGGIKRAVSTIRQKVPHTLKIEVEVENLQQLQEALEAKVDIVLLDNMDLDTLKKAVDIAGEEVFLEASGGIDEDNITEIAKTGVHFISCGSITHSAKSLDISFKITEVGI